MTPDAKTLLGAVARFLATEVEPALKPHDKGLAFRVRIAAHLAGTVAREVVAGAEADRAALGRLQRLFEQPDADLPTLTAQLARALRADALDEAQLAKVRSHLQAQLAAELAINAPHFDLRPDAEDPQ